MGLGGGGARPLEARGSHKGQFPRTDFDPFRTSTPLTTPPGPLKLRLFGELQRLPRISPGFEEIHSNHISIIFLLTTTNAFYVLFVEGHDFEMFHISAENLCGPKTHLQKH